jgi:hypothetical protein
MQMEVVQGHFRRTKSLQSAMSSLSFMDWTIPSDAYGTCVSSLLELRVYFLGDLVRSAWFRA